MNTLTIIFLANSKHVKPYVALDGLLEAGYLKSMNIIVATTDTVGPLNKIIEKHSLTRILVNSNDDLKNGLTRYKPEYLISCGWNKLLPSDILEIPGKACLNCHSSLLPDYKGASVYNHYWSNCETEAGATVHYMNEKFDAGNIICSKKVRLFWYNTPKSILYRISEVTGLLIREAILLVENDYKGIPQSGGRYFYRISFVKHVLYRIYNVFALLFGFSKKITPHKILDNQ